MITLLRKVTATLHCESPDEFVFTSLLTCLLFIAFFNVILRGLINAGPGPIILSSTVIGSDLFMHTGLREEVHEDLYKAARPFFTSIISG